MKNHQISDNMTGDSVTELPATPQCDSGNGCQTREDLCPKQSGSEQVSGCLSNEKSIKQLQPASQNIQNELPAIPHCDSGNGCQIGEGSCLKESASEQVSGCLCNDKSINKLQPPSQNTQNEPSEVNDAVFSFHVKDQMQSVPAQATTSNGNGQLDLPSGDVAKSNSSDRMERKSKRATHRLGRRKKITSKSLKKKYMLRSSGSNDRALRSKTREKIKAPESNTNLVNVRNDGEKSRRGRKKKKRRRGEGMADEFSRIRAHLRYLLNRVSYERSLIDAYSGEGWKGYRCAHCSTTICLGYLVVFVWR